MNSNPLLEVVDLSVTVHLPKTEQLLINKVNLTINRGETLALVGESGSGKSLTALAIMQLLPPGITIQPSSSIFLEQQDLLTYSEVKMRTIRGRRIAMIFSRSYCSIKSCHDNWSAGDGSFGNAFQIKLCGKT